jgi:hypothetical protein
LVEVLDGQVVGDPSLQLGFKLSTVLVFFAKFVDPLDEL